MAEIAEKRLTFEEFIQLTDEWRYELVDGRLEELVSPTPFHSRTGGRVFAFLDDYVTANESGAYVGVELDIPTLPLHGRRPDVAYYSASQAARNLDLDGNRVLGVPTLVVEITSPDDEARDTVTKRKEYAQVGILHYWIIDPQRKTALTLVLQDGKYGDAGHFSGEAAITSPLFPGLEVPLHRLFR